MPGEFGWLISAWTSACHWLMQMWKDKKTPPWIQVESLATSVPWNRGYEGMWWLFLSALWAYCTWKENDPSPALGHLSRWDTFPVDRWTSAHPSLLHPLLYLISSVSPWTPRPTFGPGTRGSLHMMSVCSSHTTPSLSYSLNCITNNLWWQWD